MARRAEGQIERHEGARGAVWRIRYRDASGRRVRETLGREPEWNGKLAERALRQRLGDVDAGYRKPAGTTFEAFARWWLDEYVPGRALKPSTVEGYRTACERHLIPALGQHPLADLEQRPELIDSFVADKVRAGLRPKTVTNLILVLRVMLKQAVRRRLLRTNPAAEVERPRVEQPEMQVLTEGEIAALLAAYNELEAGAEKDEKPWWRLARTVTFVGLGTGMRRGELSGLRWRDVALLEGHLHVRAAIVRGKETTPKSRAGRRRIELGSRTVAVLQAHWRTTPFRGDDEYVFSHPTKGTPADTSKLAEYMRAALKRAGITKPFRAFHDLRHTALTHDAAAGLPAVYVQMKAGHSQASITERYVHAAQVLFPGAAQQGEDRLFGALGPQLGHSHAEG